MSAPHYEVYACDPFGVRLADLSGFIRLSYTRVVNDWSTAVVTLPATTDLSLLRLPDGRLEIWRDGQLVTDTIWLMQKLNPKRDSAGKVTIDLEADTPLVVLREPGRFVLPSLWAGTELTATPACTAILTIWNNVASDSAGPFRRLDDTAGVSVDYSTIGQGATISRAIEPREALPLMRDIANDSTEQGTYVAFDIVTTPPNAIVFQCFLGQRGVDRRSPGGVAPVVLSPNNGTLGETSLEINYRDEVTDARAFGRGAGTNRPSAEYWDSQRMRASPWRYRELMVDYNNSADTTVLTGVARAAVRTGRPLVVLTGKVISMASCQYGVHWDWGDYVTISDFGYTLDARIDTITVTVESNGGGVFETIDASVRSETTL